MRVKKIEPLAFLAGDLMISSKFSFSSELSSSSSAAFLFFVGLLFLAPLGAFSYEKLELKFKKLKNWRLKIEDWKLKIENWKLKWDCDEGKLEINVVPFLLLVQEGYQIC